MTIRHTAEDCPQNKVSLNSQLDVEVVLYRAGGKVHTTPREAIAAGARGTCIAEGCGRTLTPQEICERQRACGHCMEAEIERQDQLAREQELDLAMEGGAP